LNLSVILQVLGLTGVAAGCFVLWGAGWAILVASALVSVLGVVLELEGS
jgi:hypothetical protein